MTPWRTKIAAVLVMLVSVAYADEAKRSMKPTRTDKTTQIDQPKPLFVTAKDLKFGDAPPKLPKGGKLAVLYGDPGKPGPYAIRFKAPDGYKIPPHWHTQDEQLTIVGGTLLFYMGDTMRGEPHTLGVGDFHFLPGGQHHAAQARGETIVQINGWGPFDIHYVNPADDPTQTTAKR
jgi:quercetin dioxygenase-like cupin family protein